MTSPHNTDQQRVQHARRVLAEASNGLLVADWGTLYWIAEQVPQLLDVIDHLTTMQPPAVGTEILGYDNGVPIRALNLPEKPCGCGVLLGEVCDCVWPGPPPVWGQTR